MKTSQTNQNQSNNGFQAHLTPAPFIQRFIANFIDYLIVGAASYLVILIGVLIGTYLFEDLLSSTAMTDPSDLAKISTITLAILLIYLLSFLSAILTLYHGYFIYFEFKKGQTPGKKLFGLVVVTVDGSPRTKSKMVLREMFRYIDTLVIPGLICMAVTEKRQRIGDLVAGTYVASEETH